MRLMFAAVVIGLGLAPAAQAQSSRLDMIQFAGGPVQTARLAGADAVAYSDDDQPTLRGSEAFLLRYAGSRDGRVFAWDEGRQKVRVSPDGHPGVWLACDQLAPMSIACSTSFRISGDGDLVVDSASRPHPPTRGQVLSGGDAAMRALPVCPADPRCPKL